MGKRPGKRAKPTAATTRAKVHRTVKFRIRGKQPPKASRWKGRRVQCFGRRIMCAHELVSVLHTTLSEKRASRKTWAASAWQKVVDRVTKSWDWGAATHGGAGRACKRPAACVSATKSTPGCSADGDQQSKVVDRITIESTDDDADAVSIAVCASPPRTPVREHRDEVTVLPPTLPSLPICPKKLAGYTIIEHVGGCTKPQ